MGLERWFTYNLLHRFAAAEFLSQATTILVLLAGGVLVYRSFRERYLLLWIQGWVAYLVYKFAAMNGLYALPGQTIWPALSEVGYVLALTSFAASVLYFIDNRRLLLPLAAATAVALQAALARTMWLPGSEAMDVLCFGLQMAISGTAAMQLAVFAFGRRARGPMLFALSLLLMPLQPLLPAYQGVIELVVGMGMVVIVLDESRTRTTRLQVMHGITSALSQAQDFGEMMSAVLNELKSLMGARAAWFRRLEGEQLLMAHYIGLPEGFARECHTVEIPGTPAQEVFLEGVPRLVPVEEMSTETGQQLRRAGIRYATLVPVRGKHGVLGLLVLGYRFFRHSRADEIEFLSTTADQLGLAVENLRMLEEVVRSQRQLASTFDSIEDSILVHDAQFRIMKVNQALLGRLVRKPASVLGSTCEAVLPRVGDRWSGCPYCSRSAGLFGEAPDPCFGGFSLVSTSSYSEGGPEQLGTIHIIKDITHQRTAEEKYRLLFQQAQEGVYIAAPSGKLLDSNDAFARMLGYGSRDEVLKLNMGTDIYAAPEQRDAFCKEMESANFVRNYEVTLRRKDGSRITVLETSFASRDSTGAVDCFQGFMLDISAKKRAEEEMRRRNRELHALNTIAVTATHSLELPEILEVTLQQVMELFRTDTGAIYLADEDRHVLERRAAVGHKGAESPPLEVVVNEDFWERVRRSRTQLITHLHLPQLPQFVADYAATEGLKSWLWAVLWIKDRIVGVLGVSSRTPREFSATDENLLIAIGRQLATTIEKVRLYEETVQAYEDLRQTQEQLLQSEKMSAVGQLISGVAHELNNPLTAILGYAQLLENENLSDRVRDFVQKLYKQAQRTHRIVQNLLSFARQRKPQRQNIDLRRVLEEALTLREYDLRMKNIAVSQESETPLPGVIADQHQLEQVFLNIINNAVDAMQEAGREGRLITRVFMDGDHVCAEIQDNGPGMRDPKRVFDPFYTTKAVGKGTGLGLSICYGILKEHGGEIVARNAADGGAVFQVRLPAVRNPAVRTEKRRRVTPGEEKMRGKILVVDDEDAVLDFEREVLTGAGADVVAMKRGDEAIARLQHETFDAIVLDSHMPGPWGGLEVYRWIAETRPELEACVVMTFSNDITEGSVRRFVQETHVQRVIKPFEVADLIALLRGILEKKKEVVGPRA
jgi:two-component system NtrC family sensor kinase